MVVENWSAWPAAVQFGLVNAFPIGICAVSDGHLLAVENLGDDSIRIYKTTDGGQSWLLFSTPVSAASVRRQGGLTTDGAGAVWLTYKNRSGNGSYVKKSTDSGATWGSEVAIQTAEAAIDPVIQYLTGGDLLHCYSTGTTIEQYRSTDAGANWSDEGTIATVASGAIEDMAIIEHNSKVRVGFENEIAEKDHAISKEVVSSDGGATYGAVTTIYDDANSWADNDSGEYVIDSSGNLEWWFATDEDDRTGTGTSPSYDKNKVKKLVLSGETWGNKTTLWDSFSNVEVSGFYNSSDEPVLACTKAFNGAGQELVTIVNPASRLFAGSGWKIDRGTAWVTKINGVKYLRVQGYPHATEPVVGGSGQRGWVSKDQTIADGQWSVIALTTLAESVADFRVASRYTDAANHYAWIWNQTNKDQRFERSNNSYATIGSQSSGTTIATRTEYTCAFTLSGSALSVSVDGIARATGSDASIASGKIALGSSNTATAMPAYYRAVTTPGAFVLAGNATLAGAPIEDAKVFVFDMAEEAALTDASGDWSFEVDDPNAKYGAAVSIEIDGVKYVALSHAFLTPGEA